MTRDDRRGHPEHETCRTDCNRGCRQPKRATADPGGDEREHDGDWNQTEGPVRDTHRRDEHRGSSQETCQCLGAAARPHPGLPDGLNRSNAPAPRIRPRRPAVGTDRPRPAASRIVPRSRRRFPHCYRFPALRGRLRFDGPVHDPAQVGDRDLHDHHQEDQLPHGTASLARPSAGPADGVGAARAVFSHGPDDRSLRIS
jgi:hypothetical protein